MYYIRDLFVERLEMSGFVSLEAFKMYYVMRAPTPSLHRESTDSLIQVMVLSAFILALLAMKVYCASLNI